MSAAAPIDLVPPAPIPLPDSAEIAAVRALALKTLGIQEESPVRPLIELVQRLCTVNQELRERIRRLGVAFRDPLHADGDDGAPLDEGRSPSVRDPGH